MSRIFFPTALSVTPAKAGVQLRAVTTRTDSWIPAFAGMTAPLEACAGMTAPLGAFSRAAAWEKVVRSAG